jgi:hypothetical protein
MALTTLAGFHQTHLIPSDSIRRNRTNHWNLIPSDSIGWNQIPSDESRFPAAATEKKKNETQKP